MKRRLSVVLGSLLASLAVLVSAVFAAGPATVVARGSGLPTLGEGKGSVERERFEEVLARDLWFYGQRMAPGNRIRADALIAARGEANAIVAATNGPQVAWTSIGPKPIDTANPTYPDTPDLGFHNVSGRVTALAVNQGNPDVVYMGAADGGVWKTTNGGVTWAPKGDTQLATQSIGAIALKGGKTLYVGTGEANTNSDSYYGSGIYRSTDGGTTFTKIGGTTFDTATVFRIILAGKNILAATNHGLYRSTNSGLNWTQVLAPGGVSDVLGNFVTDVVYLPGTNNQQVLAGVGWRGGNSHNGLWLSTNGGGTFSKVTLTGFAPQANIGRISLAVTPTTNNLVMAVVQDAVCFNAGSCAPGTVLNGIYKTTTGPSGTWAKVSDSAEFQSDPNSALWTSKIGSGYAPGVQAWYNQYVLIDPVDPNHVVVGLEEVYDSTDGGQNWDTIGRYWNFCATNVPPNCNLDPDLHPTTHPDQHTAAFGVVGGVPRLYVGNDGGVWSQQSPANAFDNDSWTDLNATLSTSQPYNAEASQGPNPTYYAGLQDNGTIKYLGTQTWPEIFGGDGGDVGVEPNNANHAYQEYVYLSMRKTLNGGQTWISINTPDSGNSALARFIAPFDLDPTNKNHIVALGNHVWDSTDGINTTSSSWVNKFSLGSGHVGTALAVRGAVSYAGWCGPCNPDVPDSDTPFARGLASNVTGAWQQKTATGLPNRYISGIAIDPANTSHIYVALSAFSRKWIPRAGEGHVFESTNGGNTFTDISSNLPDAPATDVLLYNGRLIVGTDVGVFEKVGGSWVAEGTGMPAVSVLDLALVPGSNTLIATTHGRGIFTLPL